MGVAPDELALLKCGICRAEREVDVSVVVSGDLPVCGELSSDVNRFPDGGWVRVEQWSVHGPMVDTGVRLGGNPFARAKARRGARAEEAAARAVASMNALAGVDGDA